jgi:hypothetical protein
LAEAGAPGGAAAGWAVVELVQHLGLRAECQTQQAEGSWKTRQQRYDKLPIQGTECKVYNSNAALQHKCKQGKR